ncbi:MAG: hypothetical protein KME52_18560 [Desmonostoc geniculatum HA4340-LM1]|nr:hypothetical protein [Desmonostoc geniculatum HA4340-LM1]
MKLKTLLIAASAALFLVDSFALPTLADNKDCTQQHPYRSGDRRDA